MASDPYAPDWDFTPADDGDPDEDPAARLSRALRENAPPLWDTRPTAQAPFAPSDTFSLRGDSAPPHIDPAADPAPDTGDVSDIDSFFPVTRGPALQLPAPGVSANVPTRVKGGQIFGPQPR